MRTKEYIQAEIYLLLEQYKPGAKKAKFDKKILTAARKKISLLTKCVQYLETNPRLEFLHEQLTLSEKKLEIISRDFPVWFINNPKGQAAGKAKAIKIFDKEMDKKGVLNHIKTLKYILS